MSKFKFWSSPKKTKSESTDLRGLELEILAPDLKGLSKRISQIHDKVVLAATNAAINKAADKIKTKAAKEISNKTGIKPVLKIRKAITIKRSRINTLTATITARSIQNNLIQYAGTSKTKLKAFRKEKGVTATAWGKEKLYKGTFVVRGKSSGKLIVVSRRKGASRDSGWSKSIYGPSVPRSFSKQDINSTLIKHGHEEFHKEFERQVRWRMDKVMRKK